MTCNDCGDAISMNKLCNKPIQSAADMLQHIAAHNASRAVAAGGPTNPRLEAVRVLSGHGGNA